MSASRAVCPLLVGLTLLLGIGASAADAESRGPTDSDMVTAGESGALHRVPLLPAASHPYRQGFVRVINRSGEAGEASIVAFDDAGTDYGPLTLRIGAKEAVHFTSADLEEGNAERGLSGGVGEGEGDWRLELESALDLEVLSYVRTPGGALSSLHDVVPEDEAGHRVGFFNPASNRGRVSALRLINPGEEAAAVRISGTDDTGAAGEGAVELTLEPGTSRSLSAQALESGEGQGLSGALGDGEGKWRLRVNADHPIRVMSLLASGPYLTNVSSAPGEEHPDLVVDSPSASDAGPVPGGGFTLSARVRNAGDGGAAATTVRFYRSEDATIATSDIQVGAESVGALAASGSVVASVALRAPSTPGTYFYGACADAVAGESDPTNNCSVSVRVTVRERRVRVPAPRATEPRPDLVVSSSWKLMGSAAGGGAALGWWVRNIGGGVSARTTLRVFYSKNRRSTTSGTQVYTRSIQSLGAWGPPDYHRGYGSPFVKMPASMGVYWYRTCVDAVPRESDTRNNCSAPLKASLTHDKPNLLISGNFFSSTAHPGQSFYMRSIVWNLGGPSEATTLRYHLLPDSKSQPSSDTQVGTVEVPPLVTRQEDHELAHFDGKPALKAPSTPGWYYYRACVDAVAGESDTTDNCGSLLRFRVKPW